ncbi:MAG: glucose-6-phosphate dehydrogenase [Acidimicrobiia bacterium]|nr:glucose-6-phosphate dehydrogenase [Acidimicrobiia bacterium]MDH5615752.1 glucose-6-phosphate dehydrogenase [Acidimicrobiia bacterium]
MNPPSVEPHLFVIIGASGDLTKRKLLPALYEMITRQGLGDGCRILGVSGSPLNDETFRVQAREALEKAGFSDDDLRTWCDRSLHYESARGAYEVVADRIKALEAEYGLPGNRVIYLALPPKGFPTAIESLGKAGLNQSSGWTRLVIEKPFGRDLDSARELNTIVHAHFAESQVYRIDHYLGKETVQNLLVFRFANALFENSWNRDRVKDVQITVAEDLGIGTRAGYYEEAGALRDMVQNHLTQVFTLIAMEPPVSFEAQAIRDEKVKVLRSITKIDRDAVVFGRYTAGEMDGEQVPGYHGEEGVPPDSTTETFVALRLDVDNWRWQGIPFYLRTGKRLPRRLTQIVVTFRETPVYFFTDAESGSVHTNMLVITLQPDEGFRLFFNVKAPEDQLRLETRPFQFSYREAFGELPGAYETLIFDVLTGDQTLFVRGDEVEESWRLFTPLLDGDLDLHLYEAGTWGPEAADQLTLRHGNSWTIH